ncbi:MAG: precorrin-3B synthase, partial [Caulobacteraceae bacterium]|nr:precorrin-3B synthase [Caulobacter sp.]
MTGSATVGWCPGALRPMASGDGLILRVKPRGGALTLDEAATIADLSARFGNGHLDLTSRANIQIRGARDETVEPLLAGLREADLLDRDAEIEARRNIVASPLAGLDPGCFDIRPFLAALEQGLAREPALQVLPAKWSFNVDGGGCLPLAGVPADVRFVFDAGGGLRVGLAGFTSVPLSADLDLPRFLTRLAALVARAPARMAAIVERRGPAPIFVALDLIEGDPTMPEPSRDGDPFRCLKDVVAFAPPFGDLPAETLKASVSACRAAGGTGLRLTPWRVALATGLAAGDAVRAKLAALGLIVRADDPRRGVTACVGAPACHRASAPTRTDAALIT